MLNIISYDMLRDTVKPLTLEIQIQTYYSFLPKKVLVNSRVK
jgi:hypothetical protein